MGLGTLQRGHNLLLLKQRDLSACLMPQEFIPFGAGCFPSRLWGKHLVSPVQTDTGKQLKWNITAPCNPISHSTRVKVFAPSVTHEVPAKETLN